MPPDNSGRACVPDAGVAPPSAPPRRTFTEEDLEFLERLKQRETARDELREHPAKFVNGEVAKMQGGGAWAYVLVEQLQFTNSSRFDVAAMRGSISFRDKGELRATVTFKASGVLYAGDTATLEVTSTPVYVQADQISVAVEDVHVGSDQFVRPR